MWILSHQSSCQCHNWAKMSLDTNKTLSWRPTCLSTVELDMTGIQVGAWWLTRHFHWEVCVPLPPPHLPPLPGNIHWKYFRHCTELNPTIYCTKWKWCNKVWLELLFWLLERISCSADMIWVGVTIVLYFSWKIPSTERFNISNSIGES